MAQYYYNPNNPFASYNATVNLGVPFAFNINPNTNRDTDDNVVADVPYVEVQDGIDGHNEIEINNKETSN